MLDNLRSANGRPMPRLLPPLLIFLTMSVIYSMVSLRLTTPFFVPADESLYVSLAKSLFYEGRLQRFFTPINYDFLLYPLFLSQAYHVYSPETIVSVMRIMGVLVMTSACFPAYLIAVRLFPNSRKAATGLSLLATIIPEMIYSFYLLQETLAYPVFLWLCVVVMHMFENARRTTRIQYGPSMLVGLLCFTLYAIKSYFLFLVGAYVAYTLLEALLLPNRKDLRRLLLQNALVLASFAVLFLVNRHLVNAVLNNGLSGVNHYESQIMFPFSLGFTGMVKQFLKGLAHYGFILTITLYAFWLLVPLLGYRDLAEHERSLFLFLFSCAAFSLLIVVFTIYIYEEHTHALGLRYHFRYLFYYYVPLLFLTLKANWSRFRMRALLPLLAAGAIAYAAYVPDAYLQLPNRTIIDGALAGQYAMVAKRFAGLPVLSLLAAMVAVACMLAFLMRRHMPVLKGVFAALTVLALTGALFLNTVQVLRDERTTNKDGLTHQDLAAFAGQVNGHAATAVLMEGNEWHTDFEAMRLSFYTAKDHVFFTVRNMRTLDIEIDPRIDHLVVRKNFKSFSFSHFTPVETDSDLFAVFRRTEPGTRIRCLDAPASAIEYPALLFYSNSFEAASGQLHVTSDRQGIVAWNSPSLHYLEPGAYMLTFQLSGPDVAQAIAGIRCHANAFDGTASKDLLAGQTPAFAVNGASATIAVPFDMQSQYSTGRIEVVMESAGGIDFNFERMLVSAIR